MQEQFHKTAGAKKRNGDVRLSHAPLMLGCKLSLLFFNRLGCGGHIGLYQLQKGNQL